MKKNSLLFGVCLCVMLAMLTEAKSQDTSKPKKARNTQADRKPTVTAGLLRGPYLQVATSAGIVIRWRTDALTRSVVTYGLMMDKRDMLAEDTALTFEHKVQLTGLSPRTKYFYTIGGGEGDTLQQGNDNYFVTLPVSGTEGTYRIGVFGDCGNNSTNQRNVRDQFIKYLGDKYLDSWILLGDNAYSGGTDPEFQQKFFNIYKDNLLKKYPLFPAPGNHDYNDLYRFKSTAQASHDIAYYQNFSMPVNGEAGGVPSHTQAYYSFDIGNVHFLSLDSYGKEDNVTRMSDTSGAQVQWIKKDLEAFKNTKRGWVVAYWHHPPYTMGSHNSDKESELVKIRENFIQVLERYGVDLILCGHSHVYERSKLMKGHYGMEATFTEGKYNLSTSSALYDGSKNACPYIKDPVTNAGTVYVVTGSAGAQGGQQSTYPHDAMYSSYNKLGGASIIEVDGNRLQLKFIAADGEIRDHFTMMKDVNKTITLNIKKGEHAILKASYAGTYKWNKSDETTSSIEVIPGVGKTVYEVKDPFNCLKDVFIVNVSK